jgi:NAD(P)H-hydrate repair Nnr-like enzyme with NAD(P)H-hydrate dehydratase domain
MTESFGEEGAPVLDDTGNPVGVIVGVSTTWEDAMPSESPKNTNTENDAEQVRLVFIEIAAAVVAGAGLGVDTSTAGLVGASNILKMTRDTGGNGTVIISDTEPTVVDANPLNIDGTIQENNLLDP